MRIAVIGEVAIDRYLKQNCTFVGGIGLNFALYAKRSGADEVAMVSCIGDDLPGTWVLETLAKEDIDGSQIAILAGQTTSCDIEVTATGERFFPAGGYHENVLSQLRITEPIQRFISSYEIVATQYQGASSDALLAQFLQLPRQVKRVVDFGDWATGQPKPLARVTLDALDLAFCSGDEATVEFLKPLARQANCLIVVTLGADGSIALTTPQPQWQPAIPVDKLVDSTGCGDAFQAAFTVSYFRDGDIAAALTRGAQQAAQVLQHFGSFRQESRTVF